MGKRNYHLLGVDPIMELIARQLASLGLNAGELVGGLGHCSIPSYNYMEDMFLEALDQKYHAGETMNEVIVGMLVLGYRVQEISNVLGVSRKRIYKVKDEVK